ncbi:bacteriocin immunity protein [Pseudomonas chlororaphis subsp. piscium]|nr:bacteriocin immunity protein [Pseudomonas chlororaphis subsp. piscium]
MPSLVMRFTTEMTKLPGSLPEYSESDFLKLLEEICNAVGTEQYQDQLLERFIEMTGTPLHLTGSTIPKMAKTIRQRES